MRAIETIVNILNANKLKEKHEYLLNKHTELMDNNEKLIDRINELSRERMRLVCKVNNLIYDHGQEKDRLLKIIAGLRTDIKLNTPPEIPEFKVKEKREEIYVIYLSPDAEKEELGG